MVVGCVGAGCRDAPRPWEGQDGPALVLSPASATPVDASALPVPDAGQPEGDAGALGDLDLPVPPVRVGGPWVRCYGNFRLSGDPLKDVTRLSLLCGPANGMRRLSPKAIEGHVAEGGAIVTEKLPLVRGACYRVFAVGGPGIINLDVVMRSSRGVMLATDGSEDAWPIVQPDRPVCALEDDDGASVEISARRGAGRFAAEVWVLKPPKRPQKEGDIYEDADAYDGL